MKMAKDEEVLKQLKAFIEGPKTQKERGFFQYWYQELLSTKENWEYAPDIDLPTGLDKVYLETDEKGEELEELLILLNYPKGRLLVTKAKRTGKYLVHEDFKIHDNWGRLLDYTAQSLRQACNYCIRLSEVILHNEQNKPKN